MTRKFRRVLTGRLPRWLYMAVGTHYRGSMIQTSWDRRETDAKVEVTVQFIPLVPYIMVVDWETGKVQRFRTHQEMSWMNKIRVWWFWINSTEVKENESAKNSAEEQ